MKTAIITGVTGQDGAYLSALLIEKGYRVIGLTRNNRSINLERLSFLKINEDVSLEECDLMDMSSVIKIINKYQPDEVYNLAAQSSVGLSFQHPIGTISFNSLSVLNILESIRLTKNDIRFYQASSSEMYGSVTSLPITLNTPMHPLSPYAISKATASWTVTNYRESYGLYACNGILFNHESYLRGNTFFVKKVISECFKHQKDDGWKLKVGNIDIRRDFGYSPKYVEAMFLMLQQDLPRDYTICSGVSISLRAIIEHVFKAFNIPQDRLIIDPSLFRPSEIQDIYGDPSLAKSELGWNYSMEFTEVLDLLIEQEIAGNCI